METMHKRLSVPLTERDLADLARIRSAPAAARTAGIRDIGISDAGLVHALLRDRLDQIADQVEDAGYSQLAADAEWQQRSAEIRARRRGGSD